MLGIARPRVHRTGGQVAAFFFLAVGLAACADAAPEVGPEPIEAADDALGVAYDDGTGELVFELKPVDLPAGAGHHGVEQPAPLEGIVPRAGWVNGYVVELIDEDGNAVPQDLLHHVNIIIPGRRELFSQIMQRLGAAGHETAPVRMPRLVGYPLSSGDRILLSAMLHNPTKQSWKGVRVRVRLPHIANNTFIRPVRIYPFYLDVMPPAGTHDFDLPPGEFEMAWEGQPAVSGRILAMGGHVHRYARYLRLENVTTGDVVYETKPILDDNGDIVGMPQDFFFWRFGIPISSENTYRVVVKYDNPTGASIPGGGMGAMGGIMVASGDEWPAIDPRDPEFQKDVAVTWRREEASAGAADHSSMTHSH
jgi:hypothetical protein